MAAFNFRRRQTRRWWYVGATFMVAAFLTVFYVAGAWATIGTSTFEGNDGNLVVDTSGGTDWANVNPSIGVDLPSGSSDNSFGQGTKSDNPNVTVVTGSIPPNKNDLTRFYEASQQAANGHIYLELAWERAVNIGNANLDFEINQHPTAGFTSSTTGPVTLNRTAGDLLVTYDFGGSGAPTLGLNYWLTAAAGNTVSQCYSANSLPCWGNHVALNGTDSEGAVNKTTIIDPLNGGASLGVGLFGEANIDLTAAGVFQPGVCEAFGSTFVRSRSSSSFTAEIKDFIAPVGVNVSNCGSITIHKVTENGDSSFDYSTTGGLSPSTFSLSNGGSQDFGGTANPGSYSVTENLTSAQTGAWTLKSLSCTATGSGTNATPDGATVNITEGFGGVVDCTYTNHINLKPAITTSLSATSILNTGSVTDTATLSGAASTDTQPITISVYSGSTSSVCTGTPVTSKTATPATSGNGAYAATFSGLAAGSYEFQASIPADDNDNAASSDCGTEPLTVQNQPTVTTSLSASSILNTGSVTDTATLSGATSDAGGAITISVYSGSDATACTGTPVTSKTATPVTSGNGAYAATFSGLAAGSYEFQASYAGDAKNKPASSACGTEPLTVQNQPTLTTQLSAIPPSVDVGSTVHDSATLSGATSTAGGTVTYTVYSDNMCLIPAVPTDAGQVTVTAGDVPDSNPLEFDLTGTYYWQASYSGDQYNMPATSTCTSETLVVNPKQPTASTAQNLIPNDSFMLDGGFNPGGSITFNLFSPSDATCAGMPAYSQTVNVNGNGTYHTTNSDVIATAEGTWRWESSYSGDNNNLPVTSSCGTENFTITNG